MANLRAAFKSFLVCHRLPLVLALAAVVLMIPVLWTGLLGDDLIQRLTQFEAAELPSRALETGFVASDSGKLGSVLRDLFGYPHGEGAADRARDYGIAPWWASPDWQARLFRPATAFTHWLDYRLFPAKPALMHAHSIVWYAAAVFLAAALYRKIVEFASTGASETTREPNLSCSAAGKLCVPGVAACLFLIDKNAYFPVMYVANRGFIIALVFGLLCLHAHLRWRAAKETEWMWLSALCFLLSLLANEGGASTFAFLMAFALVLEPEGWRSRLLTLLPAAMIMVVWRALYAGFNFGVKNFLLYIDPGYEPLLYLKHLPERVNGLLGGQLTGLPPELAMGLNAKWQVLLAIAFVIFNLLCAAVVLPLLRRDRVTRFWATVTLLALMPAATVVPLTKNMGFIAVGAFGVIASFLIFQRTALEGSVWMRRLSFCVAFCLVLAHVPAALTARVGLSLASPSIPSLAAQACRFDHLPEFGDRDVVVINDPTILTAVLPFDRAYRGLPLPESVRILVPGSTRLEVTRSDARTLVVRSEADLFACSDLGPMHFSYGCKAANDLLFGVRVWKPGERIACKRVVAEVLETSPAGLPRSVAFHFTMPLESEEMVWQFFDWHRFAHLPFAVPQVGETVEIPGPRLQ